MNFEDALGKQAGIMQTDVVEGEPRRIGKKEFVPLAKVTSFARNLGEGGSGGRVLFVRIKPVAVLERTPDKGSRRIPIRDVTGEIMRAFCAIGVFTLAIGVVLKVSRRR